MLKAILNLEGAQKLGATELKNIIGGGPVNPGNCHCFCYNGNVSFSASCFKYCPDGTIPGLSEGSTGNCKFPFEQ